MGLPKPLLVDDPRHGTRHAYGHYGCRCDDCIEANAKWRRARRQAKPLTRECRRCGRSFNPRRPGKASAGNRQFCTEKCRKAAQTEAAREESRRRREADPETTRAYHRDYYLAHPEAWALQRDKKRANPERTAAQQKLYYRRNLDAKRKRSREEYTKKDTPTVHERALETGWVDTDRLEFCQCARKCGRPTNAIHLMVLHLAGLGYSDTEMAEKVPWLSRQEARRYRVEAEARRWPSYRRGHTPKARIVRTARERWDVQLPAVDRFWLRVEKDPDDGHWRWVGRFDKYGRGIYGGAKASSRREFASRLAWRLSGRHLPPASTHTLQNACGLRICVNPDHWRLVEGGVRMPMDREAARIYRAFAPGESFSLDAPTALGGSRNDYVFTDTPWSDPTGEAAVAQTVYTRANITSIAALLNIAKQAPVVPDRMVERFLADEIRLIAVDDYEVRFVTPKVGWDDAGLWRGESVLVKTADVASQRGGMRHHGGGRGHKGHAKASWKGHVSRSAKGRKSKSAA